MTRPSSETLAAAMRQACSQDGTSLATLCEDVPVLAVFLRHFGCSFCREALADLAMARNAIEREGVRLCLVHMGSEAEAGALFRDYGLGDVPRIGDPDRALYRAFGLNRGRLRQLFSPEVLRRGVEATVHGHGIGRLVGDGFQMPGVFLIHRGGILEAYRHESASDRPDYAALAQACESRASNA